MKIPSLVCVGLALAGALRLAPAGFGQGVLTPPAGAPAPMMKTLAQVEPRTIVNATNTPGDAANTFIISAPGSYFLTGNLNGAAGKHGISIQANDVTLDLNGFAIIGGGGGGGIAPRGINTTTPLVNLCLRNGSVRGWSGGGVRADFAVTHAERLLLAENVGGIGLAVGNGSLVEHCVATGNTTGFFLPDRTQASDCVATVNTGHGFDCTSYVNLVDCTSSRNGGSGFATLGACSLIRCSATRNLPGGSGIIAGVGCTIVHCTTSNNGADGIRADVGSNLRDCIAHSNGAAGIVATSSSQLIGNTCEANPTGLWVTGNNNRVEGNLCHVTSAGGIGFRIQGHSNVVVRNTARAPGRFLPGTLIIIVDSAYVFDSWDNNSWGPIHPVAGGEIPSSLSAWANFQNF